MGLAETAQLLVKLTLKDETSGTAQKAKLSISDLGKTALAVGGAAGFAALTKGALEAERAQGNFMAATGASRDEAKKFVSDMNSLAGTSGAVGRSFEEIADTGTMVAQQFGVTGEKARDLTEDILKFSKVTGQDAVQAAGDLEDLLSAFGLEADDAAGFMDKLVASNQEFGTNAGPEALGILNNMAPALQAMGMEIDDGLELLNAFEVAGLDAATAQRGLQSAITELKPGENLDDLIAQIGAIEDPTERAQKAIEIFGTKAGAGLAQVIKPGMTSLDDFGISAEEAAGKMDTAADDMLTTSDKIRGMFDKLSAGARDIGQQFGPLITSLGAVSTLMAPLTGKIWAQVAALAAAKGGWISMIGAMGPFALVTGGVVAGILAINAANEKFTGEMQEARAAFRDLKDEMTPAEAQKTREYGGAFEHLGNAIGLLVPGFRSTGEEVAAAGREMQGATGSVDALTSSMQRVGFETKAATADAVEAAQALGPGLSVAVMNAARATEEDWGAIKGIWAERARDAGDAAAAAASSGLAKGLRESQSTIRSAWQDFVKPGEDFMSATAEIAWIKGKLASKNLQKGLESDDPLRRQWAEQTKADLTSRLGQLEHLLRQDGTAAGNALTSTLNNSYSNAKQDARDFVADYNAIFRNNLKTSYVVKVRNTGQDFTGYAKGGPVKANVPIITGELGRELFIPNSDGTIIPHSRTEAMLSRASSYGGTSAVGRPVVPVVNVYITARDMDNVQGHRRLLQGSSAGFR